MTYEEAVKLLCDVSHWTREEVERLPTDALWQASSRLVEARDVIQNAKDRARR